MDAILQFVILAVIAGVAFVVQNLKKDETPGAPTGTSRPRPTPPGHSRPPGQQGSLQPARPTTPRWNDEEEKRRRFLEALGLPAEGAPLNAPPPLPRRGQAQTQGGGRTSAPPPLPASGPVPRNKPFSPKRNQPWSPQSPSRNVPQAPAQAAPHSSLAPASAPSPAFAPAPISETASTGSAYELAGQAALNPVHGIGELSPMAPQNSGPEGVEGAAKSAGQSAGRNKNRNTVAGRKATEETPALSLLREMLGDPGALRKAVLLREILGEPKGLQNSRLQGAEFSSTFSPL